MEKQEQTIQDGGYSVWQEHALVVQEKRRVHLDQRPGKLAPSQSGRILNAMVMNMFF